MRANTKQWKTAAPCALWNQQDERKSCSVIGLCSAAAREHQQPTCLV